MLAGIIAVAFLIKSKVTKKDDKGPEHNKKKPVLLVEEKLTDPGSKAIIEGSPADVVDKSPKKLSRKVLKRAAKRLKKQQESKNKQAVNHTGSPKEKAANKIQTDAGAANAGQDTVEGDSAGTWQDLKRKHTHKHREKRRSLKNKNEDKVVVTNQVHTDKKAINVGHDTDTLVERKGTAKKVHHQVHRTTKDKITVAHNDIYKGVIVHQVDFGKLDKLQIERYVAGPRKIEYFGDEHVLVVVKATAPKGRNKDKPAIQIKGSGWWPLQNRGITWISHDEYQSGNFSPESIANNPSVKTLQPTQIVAKQPNTQKVVKAGRGWEKKGDHRS